jgi:hypothetical protein
MSHFTSWMDLHSNQITWFVIGMATAFGLSDLAHGQWAWALVNFAVALGNYMLGRGAR